MFDNIKTLLLHRVFHGIRFKVNEDWESGKIPFFYARIKHGFHPSSNPALRACLNFALPQFENCFRGCFSAFTRRIAGYLTSKNGETDRKQTQKGADKNT